LVKGSNLVDAISLSKPKAGQVYSATKGINFFLSFLAKSSNSGKFVFRIWYKAIPGTGEAAPTKVTEHEDFVDNNLRDGTDGFPTDENGNPVRPTYIPNPTEDNSPDLGINEKNKAETIGGGDGGLTDDKGLNTNPWDE
jgi:hypothetical protein